uniref:Acetylcholine binding protein n=1 Tax=Cupiennius salei TaxID=6928 RepID=A0A0M5LPQ4_CUPSA|nr:acetylcholine binding protein [Cupiennius salei]
MGVLSVLSLLAISAFALSSLVNGDVYKSERELRRDIFRDYDKLVRPVRRPTSIISVKISLSPLSLRSMNEKEQRITLESWIMMTWTDEYLQWNPSEYDNITELHIFPTEIWKPDIALYTSFTDSSFFPVVRTDAIVYNSGMVLWVPPFTINSRCPIPFRNYVSVSRTFVECNIRMGSWTYSGKMVDLQLSTDKVDLTNFQDYNHEWKLVKIVSNRESKLYPCCVDEYPFVDFNVTLKKRNYYLNDN